MKKLFYFILLLITISNLFAGLYKKEDFAKMPDKTFYLSGIILDISAIPTFGEIRNYFDNEKNRNQLLITFNADVMKSILNKIGLMLDITINNDKLYTTPLKFAKIKTTTGSDLYAIDFSEQNKQKVYLTFTIDGGSQMAPFGLLAKFRISIHNLKKEKTIEEIRFSLPNLLDMFTKNEYLIKSSGIDIKSIPTIESKFNDFLLNIENGQYIHGVRNNNLVELGK